MSVNRREFLRRAAGVASAAALAGKSTIVSGQTESLPDPADSGIEHIVVVMMENRSFDHLLGWLPGANGQQAGLAYLDNERRGSPHPAADDVRRLFSSGSGPHLCGRAQRIR